MSSKKQYPHQKQLAEKQDFIGQSLQFNHRFSKMVIVYAFTHYRALNPVPLCVAYYEYTTLYKHWIAKIRLPETLVIDSGTEFIKSEIIILCHFYNIRHKPRTSQTP